MDKKIEDGNQMKFLIAVMTRDYSKAEILGKSILNNDPSDEVVQQFMTLIQNGNLTRKMRESESDSINDESTSESGESDTESLDDIDNDHKIDFHSEKFIQSPKLEHLNKRLSILLHDKNTSCDFQEKIYRVLPIRLDKRFLKINEKGVNKS